MQPQSLHHPNAIAHLFESKPLMRGWFHAAGAIASVIVTAILLWQSRADPTKTISIFIFGATMIMLYTISATYHLGNWDAVQDHFWRTWDHTNIALFIAGTYTPLCVNLLTGWPRVALLLTVWLLAAANVVLAFYTNRVPRWIFPALYVAMGWTAIFAMPVLLVPLTWAGVLLMISGGLLYTVGALVYARKWPNPAPKVFGYHEIFHLFVIAGSVVFIVVTWVWVLPYARH